MLLRERDRYNPGFDKGRILIRIFIIIIRSPQLLDDIKIWSDWKGKLQDPLWLPGEAPWSQLSILRLKVSKASLFHSLARMSPSDLKTQSGENQTHKYTIKKIQTHNGENQTHKYTVEKI